MSATQYEIVFKYIDTMSYDTFYSNAHKESSALIEFWNHMFNRGQQDNVEFVRIDTYIHVEG